MSCRLAAKAKSVVRNVNADIEDGTIEKRARSYGFALFHCTHLE